MDTQRLLQDLYAEEVAYDPKQPSPWLKWLLTLLSVLVIWGLGHIYYYNRLITLEFNVKAAWAQVQVQRQQRAHIQTNMLRAVMEYAKHEREVLERLTRLRSSKEWEAALQSPEPLKDFSLSDLAELAKQINVIAEQYPQLRLTENFKQFSQTMVTSETLITQRLSEYNTAVNMYTTVTNQFPGIVFAYFLGFEEYDFYEPDKKMTNFRELPL